MHDPGERGVGSSSATRCRDCTGHEGPAEDRLNKLRAFLGELGLGLGGSDKPAPLDYCRLLEQVRDRPDAHTRIELAKTVATTQTPILIKNNRQFHKYLIEGVPVEYSAEEDGQWVTKHTHARLIDFDKIEK